MGDGSTIVISGAGIAGPTLAYWLHRHGFRPVLVERAPALRSGGYVIDFWGAGYDVAGKMGLIPELTRVGYVVEEVRLVGRDGRRVGGFSGRVFSRATGGRYVSLRRSDLSRAIYDRVQSEVETIFDDQIVGIVAGKSALGVTFERAPPREAALVIGADGLHSNVRQLVFGDPAPFEHFLGYKVAAFEAEGYRPRDELVYVSYSLPGRQVARFAMRDDRTLFLFVFADKRDRVPSSIAGQKRAVRQQFDGAGWECAEILRTMDDARTLYFDRVSQIRMGRWTGGRTALVGDAAFCPSLMAGEGAALAMVAAYVLAGELARAGGDHDAAFAAYEARMRPSIARKQREALRFAGAFAPRTAMGLALRNWVTRAMRVPLIAELALGRSLRDEIDLPDY